MKKSVLAMLVLSTMGLTACGGGSSNQNTQSPNASSPVTTSGVVNKGIVKAGAVSVCEATVANTSQEKCNSPLLTTTTDEKGQFSLANLPTNKALMVVITKRSGTQMKCDYIGCTDANGNPIEFGDWMTVPNDFKLLAIISTTSDIKTANVNSLTNLAAKKAIELTGSRDLTPDIIHQSNGVIGKALGLTKPITEMGSVDITDAQAIARADKQNLQAAILSASLEQTRKNGAVNIDDLVKYNAEGKLSVNKNVLLQLQTETTNVINQAKTHAKDSGNTSAKLDNVDQDVSALDPDNINIDIDIEKPVANAVVQAKDFIKQIRTVYTAASEGGDLNTSLTSFADDISTVAGLAQDDVQVLIENVNGAVVAISEAMKPDTNFEGNVYPASNGYNVMIDGDQYTVEDNGVRLVATGSFDHSTKTVKESEQDCNNQDYCKKTITERINTIITLNELSAQSNLASLIATESQAEFIANITKEENRNNHQTGDNTYENKYDKSEVSQVDTLKLKLTDTELTFFNRSNNGAFWNSFHGNITLIADDIAATDFSGYQEQWDSNGLDWSYENKDHSRIEATNLLFKVHGKIRSDFQEVSALLDIRLQNKNSYVHLKDITKTVSGRSCYYWSGWDDSCNLKHEEIVTEKSKETEDSFIRANIKMALGANILNANNTLVASNLSLDIARNDYNRVEIDTGITYNGKDTYLSTSVKPYSHDNQPYISLSDGKGLVTTLTESKDAGIEGKIYVNGKMTGRIETVNNNIPLIRYNDGSFESL